MSFPTTSLPSPLPSSSAPDPATLARRRSGHPIHTAARPFAAAALPSTSCPGRYCCDRQGGAWWWSPEMFELHGLAPGSADPCTELLLRHQQPGDRRRTAEALTAARVEGRSFALETQLLRADGGIRLVVLIGEPRRDPTGAVTGVEGMCADLTAARPGTGDDRQRQLEAEVEQLRTAMASRAGIEQAKGILMLLTGCGDQTAFDLLAHISSHTHRKVREVAQAITDSASGRGELPDDVRLILRDACPPAH